MKNITKLLLFCFILSSCDRITPEEKQRLSTEINRLDKQVGPLRETVSYLKDKRDSLNEDILFLESKKTIYKTGRTPVYIVTLHFQEHKMEISFDRISFSFDVPVDEQFYRECRIGEQLGSGSRSFKLFHGGDITIQNKRIDYR